MGDLQPMARPMARTPFLLAVFLAVMGTTTSLEPTIVDDGLLDDLSVDEVDDSRMGDSLYHEDDSHMDKADIKRARKVFDVLFGSGHDSQQLGESAGVMAAKKALSKARKVRRKATKATSVKATKKAQ